MMWIVVWSARTAGGEAAWSVAPAGRPGGVAGGGVHDSQTARAAEPVGAAACGNDAGKKLKAQKRHFVVDTLGLPLRAIVNAASVQDRDDAHPLLALLREKLSTIGLVRADGGYAGRLATWADPLSPPGAHLPEHHEAVTWWAAVHQMTRRLTRVARLAAPGCRSAPATAGLVRLRPAWQGPAALVHSSLPCLEKSISPLQPHARQHSRLCQQTVRGSQADRGRFL